MKKLFLVFLILPFSTSTLSLENAFAANERWKAITGKNGEDRILYDPGTVIPVRPGVFRVWITGFDNAHSPRKSLEEFDCSNKIVRDLEVVTEKPGRPIHHAFTPSDWRGIVRESPRGELMKILCK